MSQPLGGETQYTNPPQSLEEMLDWWDERKFLLSERGDVRGAKFCDEVVSQLRRLLPPKPKTPDAQLSLTEEEG